MFIPRPFWWSYSHRTSKCHFPGASSDLGSTPAVRLVVEPGYILQQAWLTVQKSEELTPPSQVPKKKTTSSMLTAQLAAWIQLSVIFCHTYLGQLISTTMVIILIRWDILIYKKKKHGCMSTDNWNSSPKHRLKFPAPKWAAGQSFTQLSTGQTLRVGCLGSLSSWSISPRNQWIDGYPIFRAQVLKPPTKRIRCTLDVA